MTPSNRAVDQILEEDCAIRSARSARDFVVRCLSSSEYDDAVVVVIHRLGPIRVSRLAEIFGASRSAMDDIVCRLIKARRLYMQADSAIALSHVQYTPDGEAVLP